MTGMSVQSLGINCFFQTIIFLYLLDNDTSWMVLFSSFTGVIIEYWKLKKAFNVSFSSDTASLFRFKFSIQAIESYAAHSTTRDYDAIAMNHLLYVVCPLVFGFSAYSLLHISHKSFYSWALGSLVGFVYAFGFVLMTPQLFINYKLKSVAHLPWKVMVYKAINTFIDGKQVTTFYP